MKTNFIRHSAINCKYCLQGRSQAHQIAAHNELHVGLCVMGHGLILPLRRSVTLSSSYFFFRQCSIDHSIVSKIPNNTNLDHHYFTSLGNLFFLSLLNADLPWIKEHIFFFLKSKKWQSPRMHFLQQYFSICNFTLEFHFSAFPTEWVNVLLNSI